MIPQQLVLVDDHEPADSAAVDGAWAFVAIVPPKTEIGDVISPR